MCPIITAIRHHLANIYQDKIHITHQDFENLVATIVKKNYKQIIDIYFNKTTVDYIITTINHHKANTAIRKNITISNPELLDKISQDITQCAQS